MSPARDLSIHEMKKHKLYILLIILIIGCNSNSPIESKFEKKLPKEDLIVLNQLVQKFDELIDDEYEGNIQEFLKRIAEEESIAGIKDKNINCQILVKFEKSTLEYRSEKLQYDTVYASNYFRIGEEELFSEEPVIMTVTQDRDTSWVDIIVSGAQTTEKKIEVVRKDGYWNHVSESSFVRALIETKIKNHDVGEYVDARKSFGELNPRLMANGILESKINTNNYFMKRIIVFEIFRKQIKKEHGC